MNMDKHCFQLPDNVEIKKLTGWGNIYDCKSANDIYCLEECNGELVEKNTSLQDFIGDDANVPFFNEMNPYMYETKNEYFVCIFKRSSISLSNNRIPIFFDKNGEKYYCEYNGVPVLHRSMAENKLNMTFPYKWHRYCHDEWQFIPVKKSIRYVNLIIPEDRRLFILLRNEGKNNGSGFWVEL